MAYLCSSLSIGRVVVALFLAVGLRSVSAEGDSSQAEAPFSLPTLRFRWPDASLEGHRRLGEAIGTRFAESTRRRFEAWPLLQEQLLPSLRTPAGRQLYDTFLRLHEETFQEYILELRGIAVGADIPFEWVFLGQISEEFGLQSGLVAGALGRQPPDHCSDYMLCSASLCLGGHNEDNGAESINRTFVLDAQLGGPEKRFLAFVYMGELPSGAFGVNARGVGFSLNWVGPPPGPRAGLGRGFVSRSLLEAETLEHAVSITTRKGQPGGHNVQLFDFCERTILNIEVAQERFVKRRIGQKPFFHANQYQTLDVPNQTLGNSSVHRVARAKALPPPQDSHDILLILGDQHDRDWPIFHDERSHSLGEKSDWSLATAVFELDEKSVTIMQGNPAGGRVHSKWDVAGLLSNAASCGHVDTLFM